MQSLIESGYALVAPNELQQQFRLPLTELDALRPSWSRLPADAYLRDGGHYRYRRHSCFVYATTTEQLEQVPHRAHWQSTHYNALHGGIERWFEPIESAVVEAPAWQQLLKRLAAAFARVRAAAQPALQPAVEPIAHWYIEAHQFRIDTAAGIGRPTPEGAHRDGVDYVAVILVERHHVKGGETRVFEAQGTAGVRFTMRESWTTLLLDDARVIHETTPILPDVENSTCGARDTLVLTFRANGFQQAAS